MADHYLEEAETAAEKKGLRVVLPAKNELFIDIDNAGDLAIFYKTVSHLGQMVTGFRRNPSPSGKSGREHITVTLNREVKDAFERIALQALLGSDRLHEMLSWDRATRGADDPTVFFEKKDGES